jgi:hypothetical protein
MKTGSEVLTEQQINLFYDYLAREHQNIIQGLGREEVGSRREKTLSKVINTLNALMSNLMKIKSFRRTLEEL